MRGGRAGLRLARPVCNVHLLNETVHARGGARRARAMAAADASLRSTYDLGSGTEPCSAATSQSTCSSQCCWCVELSLCAPSWQECQLPVASGSALPALVLIALALAGCALAAHQQSRASLQDARTAAAATTGHYESYDVSPEAPADAAARGW